MLSNWIDVWQTDQKIGLWLPLAISPNLHTNYMKKKWMHTCILRKIICTVVNYQVSIHNEELQSNILEYQHLGVHYSHKTVNLPA